MSIWATSSSAVGADEIIARNASPSRKHASSAMSVARPCAKEPNAADAVWNSARNAALTTLADLSFTGHRTKAVCGRGQMLSYVEAARILDDPQSQIRQLELDTRSTSDPGNESFGDCVPTVNDSPMDLASTDLDRQIPYARGGMLRKLEQRSHDRRPVPLQPVSSVLESWDYICGKRSSH